MKERRYMVTFESNGMDTTTRRVFSTLADAQGFARRITTDGTAWPAEAFIQRQRRESQFHEWDDQGAEVCILEGRDTRFSMNWWDQRTSRAKRSN